MIRIPNFVDTYLTSEMRRGNVKRPHWFRCPVDDSPELQMVLLDHPKGVVYGFSVLGIWEQIQKWAVRHWKRSGQFVLKDGTPMSNKQISVAIGMAGHEDFLEESMAILMAIGWLEEMENAPIIPVPELVEDDGSIDAVIHEVRVEQEASGEYSSTLQYVHRGAARAAYEKLKSMPDCPFAIEKPKKIQDAFCDALVEGRDIERIIKAMSLYYQSEQGVGNYRSRPDTFIRDRKDEEDWNTWFNEVETQKIRAKIIKKAAEESGNEDQYANMMARNRGVPITVLMERMEEWEQERQKAEQK